MPTLLRFALFGLAACAAGLSHPSATLATPRPPPAADPLAARAPPVHEVMMRAQGPAGLAALLAHWDHLPPGPERDRLARSIDVVAGQRYATVSRLYWYTDLAQAQRAARAQGRPILALRMLGRLDEDLSCANSRLFRATLYADAEVGKLLRDHFVLYWSTERPVPKVTIDFGDGRTLRTTTAGNSAHYVLDEHGLVLDVLPGLYAPVAFRAELAKSLELAARLRRTHPERRADEIAAFHRREQALVDQRSLRYAETWYRSSGSLDLRAIDLERRGPGMRALRTTVSKAAIEEPMLVRIGDLHALPSEDHSAWAAIGQDTWKLYALDEAPPPGASPFPRRVRRPRVLDEQSRALVAQLHNAGPQRASEEELQAIIELLERQIVVDSAFNQYRLRPQIRRALIERSHADWASLNAWIYDRVFLTPASDAWLGLLPRSQFSGVPGDGAALATP
ncbi:MAG: hypothetical protein ACTHU0_12255 [Kofleriaceae bacterium]